MAIMFSLICETDFVSKSDKFKKLSKIISKKIFSINVEENKKLSGDIFFNNDLKDKFYIVNNIISDASIAFGEKIQLKEFIKINSKNIYSYYIHSDGKIGSLCCVDYSGIKNEYFFKVIKDISMHIVALFPRFLNKRDIKEDELNIQKNIFKEQALIKSNSSKIINSIIKSKFKKYFSEVCLMNQLFVKDTSITIDKFINTAGSLLKNRINIVDFYIFKI